MKAGDLVYAADKTSYQALHEGVGLLIRPDEGRTYVDNSEYGAAVCWEVYFPDIAKIIVIDGSEIEVINEGR
tara:strand:- start:488 stop:703 length:216 start_codon:yes stop_codon:yes gene_type:complete